jgi:hypothetical protein
MNMECKHPKFILCNKCEEVKTCTAKEKVVADIIEEDNIIFADTEKDFNRYEHDLIDGEEN